MNHKAGYQRADVTQQCAVNTEKEKKIDKLVTNVLLTRVKQERREWTIVGLYS